MKLLFFAISLSILAILLVGCTSVSNSQVFTTSKGSKITISPMSSNEIRGDVTLTFDSAIAGPGQVNFVLRGSLMNVPLNMIEDFQGKTASHTLNTAKYKNGPYLLSVYAANDADEKDELRDISITINN